MTPALTPTSTGPRIAFALVELLEHWLQSFPTRDEPLALLDEVRILSAPVLDIAQIINHPHMKARGAMQEVAHPGMGPIGIPKTPIHYSETRVEIRRPAHRCWGSTTKRSWNAIWTIRLTKSPA